MRAKVLPLCIPAPVKKLKLPNKVNSVIIILFCIAIGCLDVIAFIGSKEQYDALRAHLFMSFAERSLAFFALSMLCSILLVAINWISGITGATEFNKTEARNILVFSAIAGSVTSIAGTVIFFFH